MVYEQKVKFTVGLWTYGPLCHVPQIPYLPQVQLGPNLVHCLFSAKYEMIKKEVL